MNRALKGIKMNNSDTNAQTANEEADSLAIESISSKHFLSIHHF